MYLVGWKEISNHLRVSVRTAQRWARAFGLPVYRPVGLGSVFSLPSELDLWVLGKMKPPEPGATTVSRHLRKKGKDHAKGSGKHPAENAASLDR